MPENPGRGRLVLTIDVERDWAGTETRGVREALPWLLERLRHHGATATFFVVADLTSRVRDVLDPAGPHEVGAHGLTHERLDRMGEGAVRRQLTESKALLEDGGYVVEGFRAPFFAAPPGLPKMVSEAGYRYDASDGTLWPSIRRQPGAPALVSDRVRTSTLGDGRTPFSLTWLRMLHPVAIRSVPTSGTSVLYLHLHELLDDTPGWRTLPPGLRHLHKRGSGATARGIVEDLLASHPGDVVSCRDALVAAT